MATLTGFRRIVTLLLIPLATGSVLLAVDAAFRASPDAALYRRAGDRLVRLSEDAPETLRTLIQRDEVTWDPTNGSELQTVLAHLQKGWGERVLLLGSSQLLTVRDDRTVGAYTRRVDKVLQRESVRPLTVYNLSMGGMTAPEKALVLERAADAARFDRVVLALTLWDSVSASRRASLSRLARGFQRDRVPLGAGDDRTGPAAVNRVVARFVERGLEEHVSFFRDRSAIQAWISDRVGVFSAKPPARTAEAAEALAHPSGATPMQYRYGEDELARAEANVDGLLSSAAAVRERQGFRVSVLLTPYRQDESLPAYDPSVYARFRASLHGSCDRLGFELIDASELLDPSHYGLNELGESRDRIDVLHFDARGHEILASTLARALGLDAPQIAAR